MPILPFKRRSEDVSAATLYSACLSQSRNAEFYAAQSDGALGIEDSYDGRVSWLTVHLVMVMQAMRKDGDAGLQLNQAIYDVMVEDFNIALREEGLADTGIARRIKPIVALFLTLTKSYTEALENGEALEPLITTTLLRGEERPDVAARFARYILASKDIIVALPTKDIKKGRITFAPF